MTVTTNPPAATPTPPVDTVTGTIDGVTVTVPKGTLIIRAAELLGTFVPRFCDHPSLEPVAACRQCLVEIEGMPKPQPACAIALNEGMVIRTQVTSQIASKAQEGVMEFLLLNHPLDCPICDKGGECPLQNQAMTAGHADSRFEGQKRTFEKPTPISTEILLDRERCVSCARCTRFSDQIAGDAFIELLERGAKQQVGIGEQPFNSYFSGNTVQICPVGALTSAAYRFRARPFDLVSVPTTCEHCAAGCAIRTDYRADTVARRLAWNDPQVNEDWNCDKGRFAFSYLTIDRLTSPLVHLPDAGQQPAAWTTAVAYAAKRLAEAKGKVGVLVGGRLTIEDSYAYAKFARAVLGTDSIDFRNRPASAEEAAFLGARVAGTGAGVTYADLEKAPIVLLVAFEPEDESPIVLLRLRKAAAKGRTKVVSVAPFASRGLEKVKGALIATVPGDEANVLAAIAKGEHGELAEQLKQPGTVILVGERAAALPGTLSAVSALADSTGAKLAWVPRRAGERGALDAGALAGLLPGGRPITDAAARAELADIWAVDASALPTETGLDAAAIVEAARNGGLQALVVAGVDPADWADPSGLLAALDAVPFVLSLEQRPSAVTAVADVVLPVGVVTEKSGTFVNWEGRPRPFGRAVNDTAQVTDAYALGLIAAELGHGWGPQTVERLRSELAALPTWSGARVDAPAVVSESRAASAAATAVLSTWNELLDDGALQVGEPYLAGTARAVVARLSKATAESIGAAEGDSVTVSNDRGAITLPVVVTEIADGVVWVPTNAVGHSVRSTLAAKPGDTVRIARGGQS
jgi:NADH-quinone oxidoreductase subunit G